MKYIELVIFKNFEKSFNFPFNECIYEYTNAIHSKNFLIFKKSISLLKINLHIFIRYFLLKENIKFCY